MCPSNGVRDQVSHPYRTTGKIIVLYIFIFIVFSEQQGIQKILNLMVARIPQIQFAFPTDIHRKEHILHSLVTTDEAWNALSL
jgi:hypothetical protein